MKEEEIIIIAASLCVFLFILMIQAALCYFWQTCLNSVDEQHRTISPPMVWLYMIPCFNIFWLFFLMINIPKSFQNHFNARGVSDVGDCGQGICIGYAACVLVSMIPYIGCLAQIPALILLVMHILKFIDLKKKAATV